VSYKKADKVLPKGFDTSQFPRRADNLIKQARIQARRNSNLGDFGERIDEAITKNDLETMIQ
jgi:hypothetical protein